MNELICVRHGESEYMVAGLTGGWTDTPLTELGRKQAHYSGERLLYLKDSPFQFYSSDLLRARETAYIIGEILSQEFILMPDLREHNNGIVANWKREEAEKVRFPVTDSILDWIPYPEAESWRMLHNRVTKFMDTIGGRSNTAVVIAHSLVIISIIHWWLELPEDMLSRISFDIDPCSITRLRINKWDEKTISKLNDTSHLAALDEL
jgi:broad specificity phosphatase PhoE